MYDCLDACLIIVLLHCGCYLVLLFWTVFQMISNQGRFSLRQQGGHLYYLFPLHSCRTLDCEPVPSFICEVVAVELLPEAGEESAAVLDDGGVWGVEAAF